MKSPALSLSLSLSIGLLIVFLAIPCDAAKVTLEKEEIFSSDGVFLGFRDFSAPVLATLDVGLIADYPSYVTVEVIRVPAGEFTGSFTLRVTAAALAGKGVPGLDGGPNDWNQDFALYVHNATQ